MRNIPLFVAQGYATFEGGEFYTDKHDGNEIVKDLNHRDFDKIGVKPDAPSWIRDEYESWLKYRRNRIAIVK
jgi:hypothetical protein